MIAVQCQRAAAVSIKLYRVLAFQPWIESIEHYGKRLVHSGIIEHRCHRIAHLSVIADGLVDPSKGKMWGVVRSRHKGREIIGTSVHTAKADRIGITILLADYQRLVKFKRKYREVHHSSALDHLYILALTSSRGQRCCLHAFGIQRQYLECEFMARLYVTDHGRHPSALDHQRTVGSRIIVDYGIQIGILVFAIIAAKRIIRPILVNFRTVAEDGAGIIVICKENIKSLAVGIKCRQTEIKSILLACAGIGTYHDRFATCLKVLITGNRLRTGFRRRGRECGSHVPVVTAWEVRRMVCVVCQCQTFVTAHTVLIVRTHILPGVFRILRIAYAAVGPCQRGIYRQKGNTAVVRLHGLVHTEE